MDILDLLDMGGVDLRAAADQLLAEIKRECCPEFAARIEEYLRNNELLPPSNRGN